MATCGIRKRKIEKLQDVCFRVIGENFSKMSEFGFQFLKRISQRLLETFKEMDGTYVTLDHGLFCLNQSLRELNLDWFNSHDVPSIIMKLPAVENALVNLSATARSNISPNVLWHLVKMMPQTLVSLSLKETDLSDEMLIVIAKRCRNLQILNISGCNHITDDGVKSLCSRDEEGNVLPNTVLRKLFVIVPRVTKDAVMFILKNFPNLSELCHNDLGEVMWNIVQHEFNTSTVEDQLNTSTYSKLTSVCIKRTTFPLYDGLMAVSRVCANVTELCIDIYTQNELEACEQFAFLDTVCFNMYGLCDCTSFFKKMGKNIQALTLNNCAPFPMQLELELNSLAKFCPELERASFYKPVFSKAMSSINWEYEFCRLTEFTIEFPSADDLLEALIFILTQSRSLKKIVLVSNLVHAFTFMKSLIWRLSTSVLKEYEMWKVDVDTVDFATHTEIHYRFELRL